MEMSIEPNYSLAEHNTFHLPVKTRWFMEYASEEELGRILRDEYFQECFSLHIGGGSNLLFINDFNGIILHSCIKGITCVRETDESVFLRVGAAEVWDEVVAYAVERGWGGIENLSLIPGETGAAAVQNEQHDPYIVTYVTLRLAKQPAYVLSYGQLRELLGEEPLSLRRVREAVIATRKAKLPDPAVLGNAGSFFKNPVIPTAHYEELKRRYPELPGYPVSEQEVKVPAGWLIEACGFKGKQHGPVGVYEKQALVLVNLGEATGHEIALVAESIRAAVNDRFGIELMPEVKYVS